jgi:hypothetical protein
MLQTNQVIENAKRQLGNLTRKLIEINISKPMATQHSSPIQAKEWFCETCVSQRVNFNKGLLTDSEIKKN